MNKRSMAMVAAVTLLCLAGCEDEKQDRGIELMPDMFHTPAYKSQVAGTIEIDARDAQGNPIRRTVEYPAMLTPPEGTIPRNFQPYPLAATDWAGARRMHNPLPQTAQVLKRGQRDYLTYCATCHGRDGNAANGYVAKTFSGIPNLNGLSVLQLAEGEIFHIQTLGRARMPNLRAQMPAENRWAVVRFVRLQALANLASDELDKLMPYLDTEIEKHPDDAILRARRADLVRLAAEAKTALSELGKAGDGHEFLPPLPPVPEYVGPSWPLPEAGK